MENGVNIRTAFLEGLKPMYGDREAENLLRWCLEELGLSKHVTTVPQNYHQKLEAWLSELKQGKPLQYILGYTTFYGRKFNVAPGVLIPRPETEELCHKIIQSAVAGSRIIDVGTGSGCIAITLALELPKCKVMASDVSSAALTQARANARALHASVEFAFSDALNAPLPGNVDVVVSNPPYIPATEKNTMHKNVVDFEPHVALFVNDDDPLIFYRQLLALNPFVREFWFEIHESKKEALESFLHSQFITTFTFHKDMQDKYRILHVVR